LLDLWKGDVKKEKNRRFLALVEDMVVHTFTAAHRHTPLQDYTRSHPEMVGDMLRVIVNLRPYCLRP